MRCFKPYIGAGRLAFPCGRCLACRINRRRIWAHRIVLESMQHDRNAFVTLTYAEPPEGGSLEPKVLSDWIKRLRWHLEPRRIRHFSVGEYGDNTARAHYHSAIFGDGCTLGPTRLVAGGRFECQCPFCLAVRQTWSIGISTVGQLTDQRAAYIAGYVTKKMGSSKSVEVLPAKYPPFARMSLKPGIGAGAVPDIASVLLQYGLELKQQDVPVGLRHGRSVRPLGRYLRRELRRQCGLDEKCPEEVIEALRQGLLPVWEYADSLCSAPGMARFKRQVVGDTLEKIFEQEARNAAAKGLIYEKREI